MSFLAEIGFAGLEGLSSAWQRDAQSDMADHAMNESASQAAQQRDYQERMYKSRYQMQTADMQAAGLNPMLAYSQSPGAAPSGAKGEGIAGSGIDKPNLATSIQSAAQLQKINAETENIKADTENKEQQKPVIMGQVGLQNRQVDLLREQAERTAEWTRLTEAEKRLVEEKIGNAISEGYRIEADTANIKVNTLLRQLDLPKARNEAEAQSSEYMKKVAPYTGELGKLVHSAAEAKRAFQPATQSFRRKP